MTVGEKIRIRREELNMSQDELARRVGYKSRSSIQKIEKSRDLPLKKVRQVAAVLDINPSYLMGWTEDQEVPVYMQNIKPAEFEKIETDLYLAEFHGFYEQLNDSQKEQLIAVARAMFPEVK